MIDNNDVYKFFQKLNIQKKIEIIFIPFFKCKKSKSIILKIIQNIKAIILEKFYIYNIYRTHFIKIKGTTIFFSSRFFVSYTYYFLKKLNKKNELVYIAPKNYEEYVPQNIYFTSIPDFLKMIKNKFIFGFLLDYIKTPVHKTTYIGANFLKKINKVINSKERKKHIKQNYLEEHNLLNNCNFKVAYIDQYFKNDYKENSNAIRKREMSHLFEIINSYYLFNNIALKFHPFSHESFSPNNKTGIRVDDYIPGEFLINNNVKLYISFCSTVINNIENGTVISLLETVSFFKPEAVKKWKDLLIKRSNGRVIFPRSFSEFEQIIRNSISE